MRNIKKEIGLAVIGCGTIGRIRAILARDYPAVSWLGLCDLKADLGKNLAEDAEADFFTTDYKELLKTTGGKRGDHLHGRKFPYGTDPGGDRARP